MATGEASEEFVFRRSESRAVGLSASVLKTVRDNAPRIVGGLKMAGDLTTGFILHPLVLGCIGFSAAGQLVMIAYGTKENQQKAAAKIHPETAIQATHSWFQNAAKVFHPRQYPVESSAGFSLIAGLCEAGYGVSLFNSGQTGFSPLLVGLAAACSYANILFGKEAPKKKKPEESRQPNLRFTHSESKPLGIVGRTIKTLKDNPVLTSSLIGMAIAVTMIAGGLIEKGVSPLYSLAGTFFLAANIVQAAFVRKSEFNVEGAQTAAAPGLQIHEASLKTGNGLGLQPS